MAIWQEYKAYVSKTVDVSKDANSAGIMYWSNQLFVTVITFLLPFSVIALIPGVYFSVLSGVPEIAALDLFIFTTMVVIGLIPGINISHRKVVFMAAVYVLSITLILYLGTTGPGLIYLYACGVFGILIFPKYNTYSWSFFNLIVCFVMGILVVYGVVPNPAMFTESVMYWIAVTSNLVFLSFLTSALLPILFRGMQSTLNDEVGLRTDLANERQKLVSAMQELQKKNNELDQFATVASHDLKEPARMVHSFVKLLDTRYGDKLDDRAKKYIEFAMQGSKRMLQLIEDVLNYAKAGNFSDQISNIDTNLLVQQVLSDLSETIKEKNATIRVDTLPKISAVQLPINLVFQNLIGNAIKYSRPDVSAEVHISAVEYPSRTVFSIKDNGIGISSEYLGKIFDLFRRLHSQEEYPGTGLGLAICKKIVEQHNGEIWAESDAKNGSTFYFSLPA
jgi:signal transduction histidine kinase